jgi:hypothetical protein
MPSIGFVQLTNNSTNTISQSAGIFAQLTGSLTKNSAGKSAFVAGSGINIFSASNGSDTQVIIQNANALSWTPASISPYNWWLASNVSSSTGLVDIIYDNGTAAKNFSASGANRCALGTNPSGKSYLAFSGSSLYTTGVPSQWTWMHNGTQVYTVCLVIQRSNPTAAATEGILSTMNWSVAGGLGMSIARGASGSYVGYDFCQFQNASVSKWYLASLRNIAYSDTEVWTWQWHGEVLAQQIGQFSANPASANIPFVSTAWRQGTQISQTPRGSGNSFSVASPDTSLTLGGYSNGNFKLTGSIYEVAIWQRCLTPDEIYQYAAYAASTYNFSLI